VEQTALSVRWRGEWAWQKKKAVEPFSIVSLFYNNYRHHTNCTNFIWSSAMFVSGTRNFASSCNWYQNLVLVSGMYVMGLRKRCEADMCIVSVSAASLLD